MGEPDAKRVDLTDVVAIVEDDDAVRASLIALLNASGFQTRAFSDAESYLSEDRFNPRCLLLDMNLRDKSGWDVLEAAKGLETSIIVISARQQPRDRLLAEGAIDVLEKPVDIPRLIAMLKQIFS